MPVRRDFTYSSCPSFPISDSSANSNSRGQWAAVLIQNSLHVCRSNRTNTSWAHQWWCSIRQKASKLVLQPVSFLVPEYQSWIINYETLFLSYKCSIVVVVSQCYLSSVSQPPSHHWRPKWCKIHLGKPLPHLTTRRSWATDSPSKWVLAGMIVLSLGLEERWERWWPSLWGGQKR